MWPSDNDCIGMPTARPTKPVARKPAPPPRPPSRVRRALLRGLLHLTIAGGLLGGLAYAADVSRTYVEQTQATDAGPITVELVNRPTWMSDYLTRQIANAVPRGPASAFDHALLVTAYNRLSANPWVRQVREVRRAYGERPGDTLVIDCDYRAPAALVRWGRSYWLVDNDGVKLPDPFSAADLPKVTVGRDGRTALRTITGVQRPPPAAGAHWDGADVAAALDTVKLVHGKAYLDDVTGVDVTNFAGRIDRARPQVVLETKYGTQVWWGRPPLADDYFVEVPVATKLATLAAVAKQYGRVDGGKAWLDVRFDTGLLPAEDAARKPDAAGGRPVRP